MILLFFSVDTPKKCEEVTVVRDEDAAFENFANPKPISKKHTALPAPVNRFPIYHDDEG